MSISTRIVRIAAGSLPKSLRDRYREQWLADVRDAPEQKLNPSQIALGSVAFAITVGRPFPKRVELGPAGVRRRSTIALGLALAAALLGMSQYASMVAGDYLGDDIAPDASTLAMSATLMGCAVLGSVLALILVFSTRGAATRTRWAVVVLAAASVSPIVQSSINSDANAPFSPGLHAAAIAYLAALVLVVLGLILAGVPRRGAIKHPRAAVVGALVVLVVGAATLANAAVLWSLRAPLRFGAGPRSVGNPAYVEWLQLKEQFEARMTDVFTWWGVAAAVLVLAVFAIALFARFSPRQVVLVSIGAAGLVLIAGGSLLGFVQGAEFGTVPLAEIALVLWLGRVALVGAILVGARGTSPAVVVPPPVTSAPGRPAADVARGGTTENA